MAGVFAGALEIERRIGPLLAHTTIVQLFRGAYVPFEYGQSADGVYLVCQRLDCFAGLYSNVYDRALTALVNQRVLSFLAVHGDSLRFSRIFSSNCSSAPGSLLIKSTKVETAISAECPMSAPSTSCVIIRSNSIRVYRGE